MAAGDITYDSGFPRRSGNMWLMMGTIEVDNSLTGFAICDTGSRILNATVMDKDGVGASRVVINDSAGTPTNGSISVDGENAGPETYYYRIEYV